MKRNGHVLLTSLTIISLGGCAALPSLTPNTNERAGLSPATGIATGASRAQVAARYGIAREDTQLPGGATCVTFDDPNGAGFVHAVFVNGHLSRLDDGNFTTCSGEFE